MSRPLSRRDFLVRSAVALSAVSGVPRRRVPALPHHVLLLVLDTVREDRFAALLAAGDLPNLAGLVARGVRFDNAWAHSSWSLPSHATMLTGRYPHEHGADWPGLRLDPRVPTLASWLAGCGYVAGAFSGNSNWVTPEYLGNGFLRFDAYNFEHHLRRTTLGRKIGRAIRPLGLHAAGRGRKAPTMNAEFFAFVDHYAARPFFAYVTFMDVNQAFHHEQLGRPFWSPRAAVPQVVASADRALRVLDGQVGALSAGLDARGLRERTVIVVASDHGESFGPSYAADHDPQGHGTSLYPEQSRVPLLVVAPGRAPAGRLSSELVGLKAIPATIAGLLGRADAPFRGVPLPLNPVAAPAGAPARPGELLLTLRYAEHIQDGVASGDLLLILDRAARSERGFDLRQDPGASRPLSSADPRLPELRAALERLLSAPSSSA